MARYAYLAAALLLVLPACSGTRLKGGWETDAQGKDPCGVVSSPAELEQEYVSMRNPATQPSREVPVVAKAPVSDKPVPQQSFRGPRAPRPRGRNVNLRKDDLAGVDHWLSARNAQWVLGDVVDVYASKEYFSTMLTLNAKVGTVQRQDRKVGEDHLVAGLEAFGVLLPRVHPACAGATAHALLRIARAVGQALDDPVLTGVLGARDVDRAVGDLDETGLGVGDRALGGRRTGVDAVDQAVFPDDRDVLALREHRRLAGVAEVRDLRRSRIAVMVGVDG